MPRSPQTRTFQNKPKKHAFPNLILIKKTGQVVELCGAVNSLSGSLDPWIRGVFQNYISVHFGRKTRFLLNSCFSMWASVHCTATSNPQKKIVSTNETYT